MSTLFTAVMTVESFVTFYSKQIDDNLEMLALKTVLASPAYTLTTAYSKNVILYWINLKKIKKIKKNNKKDKTKQKTVIFFFVMRAYMQVVRCDIT